MEQPKRNKTITNRDTHIDFTYVSEMITYLQTLKPLDLKWFTPAEIKTNDILSAYFMEFLFQSLFDIYERKE